MLTRRIEAAGFRLEATLERHSFFRSHVRIDNLTQEIALVRPQTFILKVLRPKVSTLYFEYPMRVWWQTTKGVGDLTATVIPTERSVIRSGSTGRTIATVESPDQAAKQEIKDMYADMRQAGYGYANTIMPNSLRESMLTPSASVQGDVYFESNDSAREVVLRIFAGEVAFDIPFTVAKR